MMEVCLSAWTWPRTFVRGLYKSQPSASEFVEKIHLPNFTMRSAAGENKRKLANVCAPSRAGLPRFLGSLARRPEQKSFRAGWRPSRYFGSAPASKPPCFEWSTASGHRLLLGNVFKQLLAERAESIAAQIVVGVGAVSAKERGLPCDGNVLHGNRVGADAQRDG